MQTTFIRICGALLLVVAFWNFGATFRGVPAFDAEARQEGALGDWRLPLGAAMYDRGVYLFQLGYGFANLDDSILLGGAAAAPEGFVDDPVERAERAILLLSDAVELDPGNAHAWAWLAWSHSAVGEMDKARETMAIAWELAPYNRELAVTRLDFATIVQELSTFEGEGVPPLNEIEVAAVKKDYAVLGLRDEDLLEEYLGLLPFLAAP